MNLRTYLTVAAVRRVHLLGLGHFGTDFDRMDPDGAKEVSEEFMQWVFCTLIVWESKHPDG